MNGAIEGRTVRSARWLSLLIALLAFGTLATPVAAQRRGPILEPAGSGWRPAVGFRAGLDYRNSDPSIGALVRLPIPVGRVGLAVTPSGDLVFHDGLTDRQGMVDLSARLLGLEFGGGPVALNSVYEGDTERETRIGYTFAVGLRSGRGPVQTSLELRWVEVDEFDPRFVMLAVTYTPGAPRGR